MLDAMKTTRTTALESATARTSRATSPPGPADAAATATLAASTATNANDVSAIHRRDAAPSRHHARVWSTPRLRARPASANWAAASAVWLSDSCTTRTPLQPVHRHSPLPPVDICLQLTTWQHARVPGPTDVT